MRLINPNVVGGVKAKPIADWTNLTNVNPSILLHAFPPEHPAVDFFDGNTL
jgi:hypothetical protein